MECNRDNPSVRHTTFKKQKLKFKLEKVTLINATVYFKRVNEKVNGGNVEFYQELCT